MLLICYPNLHNFTLLLRRVIKFRHQLRSVIYNKFFIRKYFRNSSPFYLFPNWPFAAFWIWWKYREIYWRKDIVFILFFCWLLLVFIKISSSWQWRTCFRIFHLQSFQYWFILFFYNVISIRLLCDFSLHLFMVWMKGVICWKRSLNSLKITSLGMLVNPPSGFLFLFFKIDGVRLPYLLEFMLKVLSIRLLNLTLFEDDNF